MQFAAKTDTGRVRSLNEDACSVGSYSEQYAWGIVCDGMGGALAGEVASQTAVDFIESRIKKAYRRDMSELSARYLLMSAIIAANILIHDDSCKNVEHRGMGTTIVAYVVLKSSVVCASVGDSRGYHFSKNKLEQITHDHSLVQELIDAGKLTVEESKNYPHRNIITRVLGTQENVEIDFFTIPFMKNDRFLICTDGLTNMVSADVIEEVIKKEKTDNVPLRLIELANENGGTDNITVAIIEK